jgi:tRNA-dihydrouridine synthase B
MGCPAPKIVKNGEGSALMLNPELVGKIIRAVSDAIKKPLTVKFRKGFDNNHINAVEIAQIAEQNGASAVAVHGRTTKQYYSGNADWDIIKEVKKSVSIPVIGNGDIDSPEKAEQMFEYTDCDAVMIGRAAQGNPWIFRRTAEYLKTGVLPPLPDISEKLDVLIRHINMLCEYKGEYIGIREARKHLGWYTKSMPESTMIRAKANQLESREQILRLIDNYRDSLQGKHRSF